MQVVNVVGLEQLGEALQTTRFGLGGGEARQQDQHDTLGRLHAALDPPHREGEPVPLRLVHQDGAQVLVGTPTQGEAVREVQDPQAQRWPPLGLRPPLRLRGGVKSPKKKLSSRPTAP